MKLTKVGPGYEIWANLTIMAIQHQQSTSYIIGNAEGCEAYNDIEFYKEHFDNAWSGVRLQVTNGAPGLPILTCESDEYPVEAKTLRSLFLKNSTTPGLGHALGLNTLTVQMPGDVEKEAEAKKELQNS